MSKWVLKCKPMRFKNGCLLIPASPADRHQMNMICESVANGVATVTVSHSRTLKTYDQCKTLFALINLYFFIKTGRYPTDNEQALTYSRILWKYAPKMEDPTDPETMVPIPFSQQDKQQAAITINGLMGEIYELQNGLTDFQEIELKELFENFYANNGYGNRNPVDYDEFGNPYSEAEWRKRNDFSFASGISDETLQLHHIISRGARKDLIDKPFNWIMLTDFEHNRVYHDKGWDYFLSIYPNCALRIKNAFEQGKHPMPFDLQKALIKLGLLDSLQEEDTIPEEEGLF